MTDRTLPSVNRRNDNIGLGSATPMGDVHREQATFTVSNRPGTLADEPFIDRQHLSVANIDPFCIGSHHDGVIPHGLGWG
jgi:hypothetical protein